MKIILGSKSKGRKRVMEKMGFDFEVMAADIDEKSIRDDDTEILVIKLAKAKAEAILPKIKEPAILITSDQVVKCNNLIREKPESAEQARDYLRSYAKYPAQTVTSVVVTNTLNGKQSSGVDIAEVRFKTIPEEIIDELIKQGDVLYQAGGFSIEDPLLMEYIKSIKGERESLEGLPKKLTLDLIDKVE